MKAAYEWFDVLQGFLHQHRTVSGLLVAISLLSLVVGIVATPRLLARLPSDYFLRHHAPLESLRDAHPVVRLLVLVLKNVLGVVLLLLGVLMLVLPGQGLLTLLVGLTLLDFPGRQWLLAWLVQRRPLFVAINWIRERAGKPPLDVAAETASERAP